MAINGKVQEYLALATKYFKAGALTARAKNWEPALNSLLHSIELSVKAALYTISDEEIHVHQVAGHFGRHFRERFGTGLCRELARTLGKYNIPRYPGEEEITQKDVQTALVLARKFIEDIVPDLLKNPPRHNGRANPASTTR